MERLSLRLNQAGDAIARLGEVCGIAQPSTLERDAALLRFALAFETAWKAARAVLLAGYGLERLQSGSPNAIIRECRVAGWLDDDQTAQALRMANDRNLMVHLYDDTLAQQLYARLPGHLDLLSRWLAAMRAAAADD